MVLQYEVNKKIYKFKKKTKTNKTIYLKAADIREYSLEKKKKIIILEIIKGSE